MKRKVEQPTITQGGGVHKNGEKITHPAFAQIGASRVSGSRSLYGSDFMHQNYIQIRIAKSELHRDLSTDWPHAREEYIEVCLSEAQWATFVSSLNCGSGVQCTLNYIRGEAIPALPDPVSRREQFTSEAKQAAAEAIEELNQLRADIEAMNISQKAKSALLSRANSAQGSITSSMPFVLKLFGEHMEQTVEKAKIEVNAYATNTIVRAGIEAITGQSAAPIALFVPTDGKENRQA